MRNLSVIENVARRAALRTLLGGALGAAAASSEALVSGPAVELCVSDTLAGYGFPPPHPFGVDRQAVFLQAAQQAGLLARCRQRAGREASREELLRFHTPAHVERVMHAEQQALTALDAGDTPVFHDLHMYAATVVGSALASMARVLSGEVACSLQPIGGLHHAARDHAAGFCVYNDLGVVIETLRRRHGIERVGYVDIDAHHGDGVFYGFESDPGVIIADLHQDGRTLFPGSGRADETGTGPAAGTKLNIELPPRAGDREFMQAWPVVEAHLEKHAPQFFILQCGADGLAGDPLAQLEYSPAVHAHTARRMCALAERYGGGRLMALGGGGYKHANLALAWCEVLRAFLIS